MITRYATASNLLAVHREVERALRDLRLAAVGAERGAMGRAYARLDHRLRTHLEHEEALLLPLLPRDPDAEDAAARALVHRDHAIILAALPPLADGIAGAVDRGAASAESWCALAEGLSRLADLLDHHDQREAERFFPALDARADPVALRAALDRIGAADGARGVDEAWRPGPSEVVRVGAFEAEADASPLDRVRLAVSTGAVGQATAALGATRAALHELREGAEGPRALALGKLGARLAEVECAVQAAAVSTSEHRRRLLLLDAVDALVPARTMWDRFVAPAPSAVAGGRAEPVEGGA